MAVAVSAPWLTVRCPCGRNTLGEVRGAGGEVRRVCRKCHGWWIIDIATLEVRPDAILTSDSCIT